MAKCTLKGLYEALRRERGFSKTLRESPNTPQRVKDNLAKNPDMYTVKSLKQTTLEAEAYIEKAGGAKEAVYQLINDKEKTDVTIAASQIAGKRLSEQADALEAKGQIEDANFYYEMVNSLFETTRESGTGLGQAISSFRLMNMFTPSGAVYKAQKVVANAAKETPKAQKQLNDTVKQVQETIKPKPEQVERAIDDAVNQLPVVEEVKAEAIKPETDNKPTPKTKVEAAKSKLAFERAAESSVKNLKKAVKQKDKPSLDKAASEININYPDNRASYLKYLSTLSQEELDELGKRIGC